MEDIPGFEGLYAVTKEGKVWSYPRNYRSGTTNKTVKTTGGKFLVNKKAGQGYFSVGLLKRGKRHYRYLHRLVAAAYIFNPSNLPQVNHKDCNKANNKVENLEWVTHIENMKHAIANGIKIGRPSKTFSG